MYESLYAADLAELSVVHRAEPFGLAGRDVMLTGPTSRIEPMLVAGLVIETGTPVRRITRHGDRWLVHTDHGRLEADGVIVTASIAALATIGFDPPLPDGHLDALAHLGAGNVVKVFATFDEAFWAPRRVLFLTDPGAPLGVFVDVSELIGRPALCGFGGARRAGRLETADEVTVRAAVARSLASVSRSG
jgi:monoamine oxidase